MLMALPFSSTLNSAESVVNGASMSASIEAQSAARFNWQLSDSTVGPRDA